MKKLLKQLLNYQKEHFHWGLYLGIIIFLAGSVSVNYYLNFYNHYVIRGNSSLQRWLYVSLFQAVPFLVVCLLLYSFKKETSWLRSGRFWLLVLGIFAIAGLSQAWKPLDYLAQGLQGHEQYFFARVARKADSLLNVVAPVLFLYLLFEKDQYKSFYGLRSVHWEWRPYLTLFAIMVLLIGIASFFQDLQAYYPRYLKTRGPVLAVEGGISELWLVAVYELAYGLDFISVELFYRGVLVMAFHRYLGSYTVLAMVPSYVFLHFGKPMTEALSSAIGGYILGIIALNSRNIWGGVLLHVGVAWLMELFGWLQVVCK